MWSATIFWWSSGQGQIKRSIFTLRVWHQMGTCLTRTETGGFGYPLWFFAVVLKTLAQSAVVFDTPVHQKGRKTSTAGALSTYGPFLSMQRDNVYRANVKITKSTGGTVPPCPHVPPPMLSIHLFRTCENFRPSTHVAQGQVTRPR